MDKFLEKITNSTDGTRNYWVDFDSGLGKESQRINTNNPIKDARKILARLTDVGSKSCMDDSIETNLDQHETWVKFCESSIIVSNRFYGIWVTEVTVAAWDLIWPDNPNFVKQIYFMDKRG